MFWGGGTAKKSGKSKVFESVFRYLKVVDFSCCIIIARMSLVQARRYGSVALAVAVSLFFWFVENIHCAGGVPAGVVFSPHC